MSNGARNTGTHMSNGARNTGNGSAQWTPHMGNTHGHACTYARRNMNRFGLSCRVAPLSYLRAHTGYTYVQRAPHSGNTYRRGRVRAQQLVLHDRLRVRVREPECPRREPDDVAASRMGIRICPMAQHTGRVYRPPAHTPVPATASMRAQGTSICPIAPDMWMRRPRACGQPVHSRTHTNGRCRHARRHAPRERNDGEGANKHVRAARHVALDYGRLNDRMTE